MSVLFLQGLPGEKGQKGDLAQPAIDVFQAVKVLLIYYVFVATATAPSISHTFIFDGFFQLYQTIYYIINIKIALKFKKKKKYSDYAIKKNGEKKIEEMEKMYPHFKLFVSRISSQLNHFPIFSVYLCVWKNTKEAEKKNEEVFFIKIYSSFAIESRRCIMLLFF